MRQRRRTTKYLFLAGCLCLLAVRSADADVRLPAIISDHQVIQRDVPVRVWGWADPGEAVSVTMGDQTVKATADDKGNWSLQLAPQKAGGPLEMKVRGRNELTVHDVLIGEVWLGSGQSNMAMTVNRAMEFEREAADAKLPLIRHFKVGGAFSTQPKDDCTGTWEVCDPESVGRFSATAYFFAKNLHASLDVPVGIINSSVGGTPIQSWIAADAQRADPRLNGFFQAPSQMPDDASGDAAQDAAYKKALEKWEKDVKAARAAKQPLPQRPRNPADARSRKRNIGGLYNGLIAPVTNYTIRGALWYQGEANTVPDIAPFYEAQLQLLVTDWRKRWGYDFPMAWVQLPNFAGLNRDLPTVREGMRRALSVPHTGMAITIDVGDTKDIHPKNKQAVGERLSKWALSQVYGKTDVVPSGPLPLEAHMQDGHVTVRFRYSDGLRTIDSKEVVSIELKDASGEWHSARGTVAGSQVHVDAQGVKGPAAVRYAWANDPSWNLVNGAGLPAAPFMVEIE